jgi:hypothetical protein
MRCFECPTTVSPNLSKPQTFESLRYSPGCMSRAAVQGPRQFHDPPFSVTQACRAGIRTYSLFVCELNRHSCGTNWQAGQGLNMEAFVSWQALTPCRLLTAGSSR